MSTTLSSLTSLLDRVKEAPFDSLKGKFHAHLTVRTTPDALKRLESFCKAQRVKLTVIELENLAGWTQNDVMTTSHYVDPEAGAVARIVQHLSKLTDSLQSNDFFVLRAKLEHESQPSLTCFNRNQYHEVHVKLRIPTEEYEIARQTLRILGKRLSFVPSRNPRERNEQTVSQFGNMRIYEGDIRQADARVDGVLTTLRDDCFDVVEVKRETTILDTHQSHDQWWT